MAQQNPKPAMIDAALLGPRTAHICVDMQQMFAGDTEWHCPWLSPTLPAVTALAETHPTRTIFTRFIPPENPSATDGAWRQYYERWRSMTLDRLAPEMLELVPPLARIASLGSVVDKQVYSPWSGTSLHAMLTQSRIETLIVTGGETDVCVMATILGAIDRGYRVVLPTDAVFGSADETHDAALTIYRSRFGQQLTTSTTQDVLDYWREER